MSRKFLLVWIVILALVLTACGGQPQAAAPAQPAAQPTQAPAQAQAPKATE